MIINKSYMLFPFSPRLNPLRLTRIPVKEKCTKTTELNHHRPSWWSMKTRTRAAQLLPPRIGGTLSAPDRSGKQFVQTGYHIFCTEIHTAASNTPIVSLMKRHAHYGIKTHPELHG